MTKSAFIKSANGLTDSIYQNLNSIDWKGSLDKVKGNPDIMGALMGGGVGAISGAILGGEGHRMSGALTGLALGGAGGYGLSHYGPGLAEKARQYRLQSPYDNGQWQYPIRQTSLADNIRGIDSAADKQHWMATGGQKPGGIIGAG